jgi:tight adherence protein B
MDDVIPGGPELLLPLMVFVAVVLFIEAAVLAWRSSRSARARRLRERLQMFGEPLRDGARRVLRDGGGGVARRLLAGAPERALQRLYDQAGLSWDPATLPLACGAAAAVGAAIGTQVPASGWLGPVIGAAAGLLPLLWVLRRRARRLAKLDEQLPDALDLISRALRAGHGFGAGLKMAADELPQPIAGEFRTVHDEVTYGDTLQDALERLSQRVPGGDMRYFVVAVVVQREAGGNLAEVLDKLAELVRARARLMARVRVLSAEGRLSAWIMGLLPFALGGALYLANPRFMQPFLTDPIGVAIMKYLLVAMAIGLLVLRRIVRIRV